MFKKFFSHFVIPVLLFFVFSGCEARKDQQDFSAPVIYDFTARENYFQVEYPISVVKPGNEKHAVFLGSNWGKPETHHDGKSCAWALDDEVEVYFFKEGRSDSRLTITCLPYTRSYIKQRLTVIVNGNEVDTIALEEGTEFKEYTLEVPRKTLVVGRNTVTLKFRYNSSRKDIAARVHSIKLENKNESKKNNRPSVSEINLSRHSPNTRLLWKIIRPHKGYLRVKAVFEKEGEENIFRIFQRTQGHRDLIFEGKKNLAVPVEIPLSGTRGERQNFELEVVGNSSVNWEVCEIGGEIEPSDVNLLLFSIDTLRADHVGAYGYNRPTTPFLDTVAANGTLFLNAFTASNESAPSHASMMTGRYPQSHGLVRNGRAIDPQQITLANILGKQGYETAAFVNFFVLGRENMASKGFKIQMVRGGTPDKVEIGTSYHNNVFASACRWVTDNWEKKIFLFLHSQFSHMNYIPEPYASMFWSQEQSTDSSEHFFAGLDRTQRRETFRNYNSMKLELSESQLDSVTSYYDGSIRYTDDFFSEFYKSIARYGLDPYFALVIVSDHGVSLGEHHQIKHTGILYNHLLHVPLVFDLPGSGQLLGGKISEMVETIDIAPTILEYVGVKIPGRMQGKSLLPAIRGENEPGKEYVFACLEGNFHSVRSERWLYIADLDDYEFLADMQSKEGDLVNVVTENQQVRNKLRKVGRDWLRETPNVGTGSEEKIPDDVKELLIKAGYLGRGR